MIVARTGRFGLRSLRTSQAGFTGISIGEVLRRLDRDDNAIPVTSDDGPLIGWTRHRDILAALATTTQN